MGCFLTRMNSCGSTPCIIYAMNEGYAKSKGKMVKELWEIIQNPQKAKNADPGLWENRSAVDTILSANGMALQYMPYSIQNDREHVAIAVQCDPAAAAYASRELQRDTVFMKESSDNGIGKRFQRVAKTISLNKNLSKEQRETILQKLYRSGAKLVYNASMVTKLEAQEKTWSNSKDRKKSKALRRERKKYQKQTIHSLRALNHEAMFYTRHMIGRELAAVKGENAPVHNAENVAMELAKVFRDNVNIKRLPSAENKEILQENAKKYWKENEKTLGKKGFAEKRMQIYDIEERNNLPVFVYAKDHEFSVIQAAQFEHAMALIPVINRQTNEPEEYIAPDVIYVAGENNIAEKIILQGSDYDNILKNYDINADVLNGVVVQKENTGQFCIRKAASIYQKDYGYHVSSTDKFTKAEHERFADIYNAAAAKAAPGGISAQDLKMVAAFHENAAQRGKLAGGSIPHEIRQITLRYILQEEKIPKEVLISHLQTMARFHKNQPNYAKGELRWKHDIDFLKGVPEKQPEKEKELYGVGGDGR